MSPGRHQAITGTNARMLFIGPLGTIYSEILIEIYIFLFKEMHMKCRQEAGAHFGSASVCKYYQVQMEKLHHQIPREIVKQGDLSENNS